ncbi:hypothetical protein LTR85_011171 [Meristemomyces frigidus]|nr:hypothetical protein LTR85_011171 [Meristemomyces frigidus]
MPIDMFGYDYPPICRIRPRFIGWIGFAPGWQDYMDWVDEDHYSLWHRWQEDISVMHLSRTERRARLLQLLRQEHLGGDSRQLEQRADKMLGMENDLGADEYGHIINRTETTTTTTTTVTQQQRMEFANLLVESAKTTADPNASQAKLQETINNIMQGQMDNMVRDQLQKAQSGQVKQIQPAPQPVQQQAQYGQYQQTTQNIQQNVQTPPQQPMYAPVPPQQQPAYAPAPQPTHPIAQQQAQYGQYQQTTQNIQQSVQAPS